MKFAEVKYDDLNEIRKLQPEGWPDIVTDFKFYIDSAFCSPIKTVLGDRIVGIGVTIIFGESAWIAHIIVDKEFRKRGIGTRIVEELLNNLRAYFIDTYMLVATEIGKPLYEKAGFKVVSEYCYFQRETPWNDQKISRNVVPYTSEHYSEIIELDKKISGENRESLLFDYLNGSKVFFKDNSVKGYYIPDLGEGLIIADAISAGLELMKIKYSRIDKAVIPAENSAGISFLKQNGFVKTPTIGTRMAFGGDLKWNPDKIFSRIGGNFG
jgi:GNAT superfamily N-acetyltransferase